MFNSEKEIMKFISDNGIFIKNDGGLCVKTGENKYQTLEPLNINGEMIPPETRLIEFIKNQTYPFIDINLTFPQIDVDVYKKHFSREAEIKNHQVIQQKVNDAKPVIKKNFRLIYFERVAPSDNHYYIYQTTDKTLNEYDNHLITDEDKTKKISFKNKIAFQKIMRDDLKNPYHDKYLIEKEKFQNLNINTTI